MEPEKISEIIPRIKIEKKPQEEVMQLPVVKKESTKIPTPMQAMELSLIFNTSPKERKRGWCKRYLKNDYYIEARAAIPKFGNEPDLIREEDLNTLLVCFLLLKHSIVKLDKYTFETTPYQITKLFRQPTERGKEFTGGKDYKWLRDSLCRMQANKIETNFWWDSVNGERVIQNNFSFLSSVTAGEQRSLRITFAPEILRSLEQGYVKFLEEKSLLDILKLRGHAKVLALFLIKLIGSKPMQVLNIETVLKYLGLQNKYHALEKKYFNLNVKKVITPAMEKASKSIGISCTYNKDKQQFHLRRIKRIKQIVSHKEELSEGTGAKRVEQERENERGSHDPLLTQRKNEAFKNLIDIGVASEMIIKLFDESDIEEIERQIEWLPYRKSDNPAGILVSAIRDRWIIPAEYEQTREKTAADSRMVDK